MYTKSLSFAAVLSLFAAVSHGQVVSNGACPTNVQVVSNFNVAPYLGKWFEYAKYPVYFEGNGDCITAQYGLQEDGNVSVLNSQVNGTTGVVQNITGFASIVAPGKLMVTFPVSPAYNASSNYWVLGTDYESYSVVYSCQPLSPLVHTTTVWILTREQLPCGSVIEKALDVLAKNNISLKELTVTKQIGCPASADIVCLS